MPVLYPKRRYGEGDAGGKPGEWERRQATELVDLSDSLETASREIKPEYLNVEGIPDVWAHPLLFELALYDDNHPLHSCKFRLSSPFFSGKSGVKIPISLLPRRHEDTKIIERLVGCHLLSKAR